MDIRDGEISTK